MLKLLKDKLFKRSERYPLNTENTYYIKIENLISEYNVMPGKGIPKKFGSGIYGKLVSGPGNRFKYPIYNPLILVDKYQRNFFKQFVKSLLKAIYKFPYGAPYTREYLDSINCSCDMLNKVLDRGRHGRMCIPLFVNIFIDFITDYKNKVSVINHPVNYYLTSLGFDGLIDRGRGISFVELNQSIISYTT
jgi:hypothetical protein